MKRRFAFYPPLLAIFPILAVYFVNMGLFPMDDLWRPLGIGFVAGIGVWLLGWAVMRDVERGSVLAIVLIFGFWMFGWTAKPFRESMPTLHLVAYPLLVLAIAVWAIRRTPPTVFLNRLATFLMVIYVAQIGWRWLRPPVSSVVANVPAGASAKTTRQRPPDIFYIILDGYGRQDQLKRSIGFDNSAFVRNLEELGFYVPARSHSNYCQTAISLASSLNLDYVQDLLPAEGPTSENRWALNSLVNDSALARTLKTKGYSTVAITTGFPSFFFEKADLQLEGPRSRTLFEATLFDMTPVRLSSEGSNSMFEHRRKMLLSAFAGLQEMAKATAKPRFIFAHILAPHPPFSFNADGSARKRQGPFGYWDGSDYMEMVGTQEEYREGYTQQVQYVNKLVLETVRKLVASDRKPIIILQGDHGSKLHLNQSELAKTDIQECFANLAAFYVPETVKSKLYPEMTPVNTFRILLDEVFGDKMPLRPDRSYYSPFAHPFAFTEVTDKLK